MKNLAIVLAGGNGSRMQSSIPKQFLVIKGLPVLMHTLQAFYFSDSSPNIILVIAEAEQPVWTSLIETYNFKIPHTVVNGGRDRFESVFNGLLYIKQLNSPEYRSAIVAIHDGVRPLVSNSLIKMVYDQAAIHSNAVPCLDCRESLRLIEGEDSHVVDRRRYRMIQTPQCFNFPDIFEAYEDAVAEQLNVNAALEYSQQFTDDASVAQHAGIKINLVKGEYRNIKITLPEDLIIAGALINTNFGELKK